MSTFFKAVDTDVSKIDDSIAINNDISSNEAKDVSANIRQYMRTGSNQVLTELTEKLNEKPKLRDFIFPTKFKREYDKLKVEEMQLAFKGRQAMLEAVLSLQLNMAKRMSEMMIASKTQFWEGELSKQAMQIRAELTAFSQQKLDQMKTVFDKSRINFGAKQDLLYNEAEKVKHRSHLYERYRRNLETEEDIFFDTIDELLIGFLDSLKNKLSEYKAT